jgi:hypothetical protein
MLANTAAASFQMYERRQFIYPQKKTNPTKGMIIILPTMLPICNLPKNFAPKYSIPIFADVESETDFTKYLTK